MPGAGNGQAFDPALGERTALVRTCIVEGIKRTVGVEEGDFAAVDDDRRRGARRDIGNLSDGNEFDGHASQLCEGRTTPCFGITAIGSSPNSTVLGNANHHAYSLGQANMAKRAIEELDKQLAPTLYVPLGKAEAQRALTELELLEQRDTSLPPGLIALRDALRVAFVEAEPPADEGV